MVLEKQTTNTSEKQTTFSVEVWYKLLERRVFKRMMIINIKLLLQPIGPLGQ